jgi:hypothetical protein
MCCASLLETVTEKNYPTLAPLCVNNPYFLYAPYFPTTTALYGHCWAGALAHLGVARANALQSRTSQGADADAARVRALAAYKDVPHPLERCRS